MTDNILGLLCKEGLIDGMDTFIALALLALIGALLGFLAWNYRGFDARQAKFFLGDSGSMTLGFLVAYLAINTAMNPHAGNRALVPPITVAWIVALPAAEMLAMIFKRLVRGTNPMAPDQTHLHHLLMRGGFSPWQTGTLMHMVSFAEDYRTKYDEMVLCFIKNRRALLAFYDFSGEHWDHLRTCMLENIFATVQHRTVRIVEALWQKTAKLMLFKLVQARAKTWHHLRGQPVAFGQRRLQIH